MIRHALAAAALLAPVFIGVPAAAQSQHDQLDSRYDRALAAGYKALFLCSAIANAERNGATRTPESVIEWELTGIQAPLDEIVGSLPYEIVRAPNGQVSHVSVKWDDSSSRFARHDLDRGCKILPMGADEPSRSRWRDEDRSMWVSTSHPLIEGRLFEVGRAAFGDAFGKGARTTAVVVVAHGRTLIDQGANAFDEFGTPPQRTWSVAKSIATTLVGAAVQRGRAEVQASAGLGASVDDPRRAITIDNLLRMASGRYSDTPGNSTDPLYFGGSTVDETAAHWPLIHPPGSVFRYANNDTLMAIEAISGTFEEHPPAEFFRKLGMHDTVAEADWQGDYILSSQVWSTARDLAKLGQLYLDDGILPNGERILPENWLQYVSAPSGPQPPGEFGYGAGFWLFNKSSGIPADTIAMQGNRGQYVVIVPSRDIVIVRRGEDPAGARFDIAAFTRDLLAQIPRE